MRRHSIRPISRFDRAPRQGATGAAGATTHANTGRAGAAARFDPRRGTSIVEMAVVAPVFFMVVLGIIEFGRGMMVSQLVTNAAREGARAAVIDGSSNSAVTQQIEDFLQDAANVDPAYVSVTITVDNPDAGNEVANAQRGDACTINVQVPFNQVQYIPGDYLSDVNLVGESTMRHE